MCVGMDRNQERNAFYHEDALRNTTWKVGEPFKSEYHCAFFEVNNNPDLASEFDYLVENLTSFPSLLLLLQLLMLIALYVKSITLTTALLYTIA